MAHRIHRVAPSRKGDVTHVVGGDDDVPAQISFVYEELMDWVNKFRDEIAALQDHVQELEKR